MLEAANLINNGIYVAHSFDTPWYHLGTGMGSALFLCLLAPSRRQHYGSGGLGGNSLSLGSPWGGMVSYLQHLRRAANCGSLPISACRFCVESPVSCVLYLTFFLGMPFVWMDPLSSFFRSSNQQVNVLKTCMSANFSTPVP